MTYVITQNCCNDASCVDVCPVACIHPAPGEPGFGTAEMLYIDPIECIDCGACQDACPVSAVYPDYEVPAHLEEYTALNADFISWAGDFPAELLPPSRSVQGGPDLLKVAVVGAGPAGWYVIDELLNSRRSGLEITVFDRLSAPFGLIRYGVAPDHLSTKAVTETFQVLSRKDSVRLRLNVEVGRDVSLAELRQRFHAVVFATGASEGRDLGIPGEGLPGSFTAGQFVGWYSGHPDHRDLPVALDSRRAVVVGNGNVALDIVRMLLADPDDLQRTDMAQHAVDGLAGSVVDEVVVVARRGAEHAAFTSPELRALVRDERLAIDVDPRDVAAITAAADAATDRTERSFALRQKADLLTAAARSPRTASKRLVLRFGLTPAEITGTDRTAGIRLVQTDSPDGDVHLDAGLIIRATGYRSAPIDGVPMDAVNGLFVHEAGRVLGSDGAAEDGVYSAGWAKRGPTGVIGTNRACAAETVRSLLEDMVEGALATPEPGLLSVDELLESRGVTVVDRSGWNTLDAHERSQGEAIGRPRVKVVEPSEQLRIAAT